MSSGTFLNLNWLKEAAQIFQGKVTTPWASKTTHEWKVKQTKLKIVSFSKDVTQCFVNTELREN